MSSDDEAFNQFIVTSEDEDDKENGAAKSTKTNQNQFDMMILFSKEIDKLKLTKAEHDNQWHELTDKLNEIGPPMRGCWEWRRVWSVYKYNQKRKQPASIQSNMKRRSNPDAPFSVRPPAEQLPSTLQFPELIGPVTMRTAVESQSNPDICPPADTITPSALPCNEQIIQSITVPVMTKLTEMVNILKESNELLKQLVARQLE